MFGKETLETEQPKTGVAGDEGSDKEDLRHRQERLGLRLIHGGKGGSGDKDWLTPLPQRIHFIAEPVRGAHQATLFRVEWKGRVAVLLRATTLINYYKKNEYEFLYVNPKSFCEKWNLVEVIDIDIEEDEEEEDE